LERNIKVEENKNLHPRTT